MNKNNEKNKSSLKKTKKELIFKPQSVSEWKKKAIWFFNALLKNQNLGEYNHTLLKKFWDVLTSMWSNIKYILLRYVGWNFQSFETIKERIFFEEKYSQELIFLKDLENIINNLNYLFFFFKNFL